MLKDKKTINNEMTLILIQKIGKASSKKNIHTIGLLSYLRR